MFSIIFPTHFHTFLMYFHISVLQNALHLHHITPEFHGDYQVTFLLFHHHHSIYTTYVKWSKSSVNQLITSDHTLVTFLLPYLAFTIFYNLFLSFPWKFLIPSSLSLFYIPCLFLTWLFSLFFPFEFKFLSTKTPVNHGFKKEEVPPCFPVCILISFPSPNCCPHQLQYLVLLCDKNSTFFHTSDLFSLCFPHSHWVNFVCVVSTPHHSALLWYSPCVSMCFDCIFHTFLCSALCVFCLFTVLHPGTLEHLGCVWDILYALAHILLSLCFVFPLQSSLIILCTCTLHRHITILSCITITRDRNICTPCIWLANVEACCKYLSISAPVTNA